MKTIAEKLHSGVTRGLLAFKNTPCTELPSMGDGFIVAVPGPKGHRTYIFNIRERLKTAGFRFDGDAKVWYRPGTLNGFNEMSSACF